MSKKSHEKPASAKASSDESAEKKQKEEKASLAEEIESVAEGIEFPSRDKLEDQLTAMEMKVDEYKNQYLRGQAELENLRRRTERDISNAHKFGTEKLLADFLPVVDSLVRGLESPESRDPQAQAMREGVALTLDLLEKTLIKHGVNTIEPKKGEPFNPEFHEAMSALSDPDADPNTIAEVIQKGYQLNGRVLRAAMVIVVK